MAVTQRHRTVVNPARRKLSAKQIAAGFGGKRRQSAVKHKRKAARKNKSGPRRKPSTSSHRPRTKKRSVARRATKPNLGKIISFTLPKESSVATTKQNRGRRKAKASGHRRRPTKKNTGHRRRGSRRNPGMGNLTGLVSSAVFVVAGAVGAKYLTQMVLQDKNTGVMGYLGNLVSAFLLSWGVKAFLHNPAAATSVLSGGIVQVVLRLIADYTPFGQYTASLGMGDYLAQNFVTPQRLGPYNPHSAALATNNLITSGLSGCNSLYGGNGLYGCAA